MAGEILMGNPRLRHEAAYGAARALLHTVAPALRPEEQKDAFHEFYAIVTAALEAYDIQAHREAARLQPSRN
jgi:hypothetical protein